VAVVAAGWDKLVQNGGQVMLQARLKLNRANCSRAPNIENVRCASLDSRGVHDRSDLLCDVVHVTVPLSADRNVLLVAHDVLAGPQESPGALL